MFSDLLFLEVFYLNCRELSLLFLYVVSAEHLWKCLFDLIILKVIFIGITILLNIDRCNLCIYIHIQ